MSTKAFKVEGANNAAPFQLTIHRGEGMALLAMNWKNGKPPKDFVGFGIQFKEPGGKRFYDIPNRLSFNDPASSTTKDRTSSLEAPIQMFRWVHFPSKADLKGEFLYRITPLFMDDTDVLRKGEVQEAAIELARETYPNMLNVAFTRGFIASQAFVDRFAANNAELRKLLPAQGHQGLSFRPTHPKADEALTWMGFEARKVILELLDEAIADAKAQVRVLAYDLNEPEILSRLEQLGERLMIIIDDSAGHGDADSPESKAARKLGRSAGAANVKRQHVGGLQHNKTIVVNGPKVKAAVCGSTNFTWRGLFVQNNHAVILRGRKPVEIFNTAFDDYWDHGTVATFARTGSSAWSDLGLSFDAKITFSPRKAADAVIKGIAEEIRETRSSLFFSLAFLYQTPGAIREALQYLQEEDRIISFGISDHNVGVLRLKDPSGKVRVVYPAALGKTLPAPFKPELTGGGGNRMHHKFLVIDFDTPDARVYFGSFNFSKAADGSNGENLLLVKDRRVATAFMIEAVRIYDHYKFRVARAEAKADKTPMMLKKPPRVRGEKPWWDKFYTHPAKAKDRELFAK